MTFDIPELDRFKQPHRIIGPVTKWGTRARTLKMPGTWHFYTHDYKFTAITRAPAIVPETGCKAAIEINYTVTDSTPEAIVIYLTYTKRLISQYWQMRGISIFVDLNVGERHRQTNLIGVPRGWRAYATRKHQGVGMDKVEEEYELAQIHSETAVPFFVVVGGGKKVRQYCRQRSWSWIPEHRQVVEGNVKGFDD